MGARAARTQGASVAALPRRLRTRQRGRTARPCGTTVLSPNPPRRVWRKSPPFETRTPAGVGVLPTVDGGTKLVDLYGRFDDQLGLRGAEVREKHECLLKPRPVQVL